MTAPVPVGALPVKLRQVGVTAWDEVEAGPSPALVAATTVKVYVSPLVSPVTSQVVAVAGTGVQVWLPSSTGTTRAPSNSIQYTLGRWRS